jgi:protein disulfide-isomerase A6
MNSSDSVSDYDGGRIANDIVTWSLEKLAENVPAPEVVEIIDKNVFKEACDQKPLCVVALLPHILDCQSECRNNYINILKELGEKYKKKMWG